jgi:hypothetical protein
VHCGSSALGRLEFYPVKPYMDSSFIASQVFKYLINFYTQYLVLNVMRPTGFVIRNMFSPKYSAPRFVLVTSFRPNKGSEHWLQMTWRRDSCRAGRFLEASFCVDVLADYSNRDTSLITITNEDYVNSDTIVELLIKFNNAHSTKVWVHFLKKTLVAQGLLLRE